LVDSADSRAAPFERSGAAAFLFAAFAASIAAGIVTTAAASPDGAEWNTVSESAGCLECHRDSPALPHSQALTLEGLPLRPMAGQRYELTVAVRDSALRNSGFLLSVLSDEQAAGEFDSLDGRTETNGAQARSNYDSSTPDEPGEARWRVAWTAPASIDGPLRFDLWANAGNYDLSPLGDRLHHRIWYVPLAR
jgi:hypothetical protein